MEQNEIISRIQKLMITGTLSKESGYLIYSKQYDLPQKDPICTVQPGNVKELEDIIHFANDHKLNLTVKSSTGIHRKGGFTNENEHILVSLTHWNKIDLIDRRNRVCRVEPGVTYEDLLPVLAEHGMTIPIPLAPRDGKSILASVMDREPSTWCNKQWDNGDPVGSTEFFFGSGERFRTGAAGGPGSIQQQREAGGAQKYPQGPSQTDFHRVLMGSQGTMGIVNWVTLRTEIQPTIQEHYLIGVEELAQVLNYTYKVQRGLLGEQSFILNATAAALLMAGDSFQNFEEIKESLTKFICFQSIAGFERLPKERLAFHKQDIAQIANNDGLELKSTIGKLSADSLFNKVTHTCGEKDWRDTLRGDCLSIIFQTTLNRAQVFLAKFSAIAKDCGILESDIGVYIQPMVQNHMCHIEFLISFDLDSSEEVEKIRQIEKLATKQLMEAGGFFSRPYGTSSEIVWGQNSENLRLLEIIKDIFDPNQVLQRGKWFKTPESARKEEIRDRKLSELEDIVGKQWVSTIPCVLDTYAYYMNPEIINKDGSVWLPRPAAVVLPRSTAEVQEIMRFCSTSQYMAKPISTGFHCAAAGSNDKVILIDLKRMNNVIEVDYQNQIAVVEPYVRAFDLQTDIVRKGLTCHIVSSGASHSLLASHAAAWGYGVSGSATSYSGRNLLGVEWVLPTGEVITLGSAGSGSGWFTADGPGPSLRGIVRGFSGTLGGLGVFTKAAIKLFKWDGPRDWEVVGKNPKYVLKKVPPRCALHAIAFPSRQA